MNKKHAVQALAKPGLAALFCTVSQELREVVTGMAMFSPVGKWEIMLTIPVMLTDWDYRNPLRGKVFYSIPPLRTFEARVSDEMLDVLGVALTRKELMLLMAYLLIYLVLFEAEYLRAFLGTDSDLYPQEKSLDFTTLTKQLGENK